MSKKKITLIIMLVLLFIGLCVLLYPSISSYWNSKVQSRAVSNYEDFIKSMMPEDYDAFFEEAEAYNASLREVQFPLRNYNQVEGYFDVMNLNGEGMMGYVTIDSIGVEIPIYHGTSDKVLAFAAGHMQGTSIPIGGESTHSVLSAHRGLPNARLFTDLPKVQVGDSFTVTILDRVMIYQVDQILTVLPENTTEINVVEGKDYCTLITCTPYGINSHRLLVRGTRVETLSTKQRYVGDEAYRIDELVVTPIVALPIILILLIIVALQPVKQIQIMDNDMYDDDDEDEELGEDSEPEK